MSPAVALKTNFATYCSLIIYFYNISQSTPIFPQNINWLVVVPKTEIFLCVVETEIFIQFKGLPVSEALLWLWPTRLRLTT